MHIDPWLLAAALSSAAAVRFWLKANRQYLLREYWYGCSVRAADDAMNSRSKLLDLQHSIALDTAKRREIARLGGKACQAKRAAADLAEAPARRASTTAALAATQFRPREEVVAGVAAQRAARRNPQSASVAAN